MMTYVAEEPRLAFERTLTRLSDGGWEVRRVRPGEVFPAPD